MAGGVEIEHAGERLRLTGTPGVVWGAMDALIVADVHLGKAAAFRDGGVPVPEGTTVHDLTRLSDAVARAGVGRLIVLGDLVHASAWRRPATREAIERWRRAHRDVEMLCVRGNHDRNAGRLPPELEIREVDEPHRMGALTLVHDPARADSGAMGGHLHPVVRLRGAGGGMRSRCFWRRDGVLVLPAFGSFTGGMVVRPEPGDEVWATSEGHVTPVTLSAPARRGGRPARRPTGS